MNLNMIQFRPTKRKNKDIAARKLPEQESSSRYIPPEIVEEIVLNLPVKSLLRFSTVSKSWSFMIHSDQRFIRKYRSRAALPGRERVLISQSTTASLTPAATLPLSCLLSNQAAANTTPLIIPFEIEEIPEISLLASCGELWCVECKSSLLLWNPSMGTFKKLPNPSHLVPGLTLYRAFDFGIGYDSVEDDYKILKMSKGTSPELYSLRKDSWKTIRPFSTNLNCYTWVVCASGDGVLYWVDSTHAAWREEIVVSFDLSTEKYAEVAQPPYDPVKFDTCDAVTLSLIKGKLCLHVRYGCRRKYVLWVREDCEWSKMFDIDYCSMPRSLDDSEEVGIVNLAVLYHDNGKIVMDAMVGESPRIFMYMCMDGESIPQTVYRCNYDDGLSGELYVESLVSPATYCSRPWPWPPATRGVVDGGNKPRNRICASFVWVWSFLLYCLSISCSVIEIILGWKEKLVRTFT